jgi:hypothetical protein
MLSFLDVQWLNGGGFEFLESMRHGCGESPDADRSWRPAFVIVTAAEESAVKAFDVGAPLYPQTRQWNTIRETRTRVRHHVRQSRRHIGSVAFDGTAQRNSERHAIVNIDGIKDLLPWSHGE